MRGPTRQVERLLAIRLGYTINTHEKTWALPRQRRVGAAVGLPAGGAVGLLTRRLRRTDDMAALPGGLG